MGVHLHHLRKDQALLNRNYAIKRRNNDIFFFLHTKSFMR